ncbi:MAG: VanZ family protein [Deltaproteobacteria bacterium]|nr:VanZ family protein [Deltaproteobacteria bacterium]
MKKILRYWIPFGAILIGIFLFSSTPDYELKKIEFPFAHLIGHIVAYFLMGFLLCRALTWKFPLDAKHRAFIKPILISAACVLIYAISDEWHQSYVPGRNSTVSDVLLDLFSGIAGAATTILYRPWANRLKKH